jgi:hypothetical protein
MKGLFYQITLIILMTRVTYQQEDEQNFWEGIENEIDHQRTVQNEMEAIDNNNINVVRLEDPKHIIPDEIIQVGGNETQHMKNFKQIAHDIQIYEENYKACIHKISNNDFTEKKVNECVGNDFEFLINDLDFFVKKIIAKVEQRIRTLFIEECYKPAGLNEVFSSACDVLEKDCLTLLWEELNFYFLLNKNKIKYTFEEAKLDDGVFDTILQFLDPIRTEWWDLLNEAYNHKDLTVVRIKAFIDEKTKLIVANAAQNPLAPRPQIFKHQIQIEEKIINPDRVNIDTMPRDVYANTSTHMYKSGNPKVQEFRENYGDQLEAMDRFSNAHTTVVIPTNKKKFTRN